MTIKEQQHRNVVRGRVIHNIWNISPTTSWKKNAMANDFMVNTCIPIKALMKGTTAIKSDRWELSMNSAHPSAISLALQFVMHVQNN